MADAEQPPTQGEGAAPAEVAAQDAPAEATAVATEVAAAVAAAVAGVGAAAEASAAGVKRQLEGGEVAPAGGAPPKRAFLGAGADGEEKPSAIKILVQNKDAGTVIGRGGGTVQRINELSGARTRVSNAGEHFPGTMERVVLVTGTTDQVAAGAIEVLKELYKPPDGQVEDEAAQMRQDVLIPDRASGTIIGKGGENVRTMCELSGCKIQLSGREKQVPGVDERVLTLLGTKVQICEAARLVIHKISEEGHQGYQNMTTSYKHVAPPQRPQPSYPSHDQGQQGQFGFPAPGGYGGGAPAPFDPYAGYAAYNQAPGGFPGYPPQQQSWSQPQPGQSGGPAPYGYGDQHHGGAPAPSFQQSSGYQGGGGGGGGAPGAVSYQVQCADHVVSAILGRGGSVIKEMIQSSGASIRISQKGEYAPGTQNRIVTIAGTEQAANYAHQLVTAKIANPGGPGQ